MSKFYGPVGYVDLTETAPGVWTEVVNEVNYFGDVKKNIRRLQNGTGLNDNVVVNTQISIMADAYANEHFFAIRYVEWSGAKWKVSNIEVHRPRLILTLGEVYNG